MGARGSKCFNPPERTQASPAAGAAPQAQGEVQKAFANQADWEAVFDGLGQNAIVQDHYGELLQGLSAAEAKILQTRTLVPLAKASWDAKPQALKGKREGILNGYKNFAEKKGIDWRADAGSLEARGPELWESERSKVRRVGLHMPEYYLACGYDGPLHSYDRGNGEWAAAFDAPSAYLLVHLHHYPELSPQAAFDALHEELDTLALKHLLTGAHRPLRCVDVGCGVGTSTFSTVRSVERSGRCGKVTGVDLSDYFVAVARHIQQMSAGLRSGDVALEFLHGNGLDLTSSGFADGSIDLLVASEVTHEMPKKTSEALIAEAARALAAGGVFGYLDLNPAQILKENAVGNLVDRIATSNEPYFDQYLELDVPAAMRAAGLEVLEETWPNHAKYPTLESCSLRIIIARKPIALTSDTWTGKWALERRENWSPYLSFLGVPEAAHEAATTAPDFHETIVSATSFFMDHRIPGQGLHLRFTGLIDGEFQASPYPKPTATMFAAGNGEERQHVWKHDWVEQGTCFVTTMPDFAGKGNTVTLRRELESVDVIKYTVHVMEPTSGDVLVGPCYTWMKRTSTEAPVSVVKELQELFATGISKDLEWRLQAIDRAAALVLENVDAWSAAQAADHVTPSGFVGASMMVTGAIAFYKANLRAWAAPQAKEETLPPFMQTEGHWEVVPEPKGVGLVIAPWNAPVLLCALPMIGMLAAGNLCVLKPSEAAPTVSRLLARLVPKYFPDRSVVVAEGGKEVVESLIDARVDHILFTGGGSVARRIAELAARHLTPVSLELGGKNPCFVGKASEADLALYAAEIVGTKSYFGGQFCQAHDYCLVQEDVFDEFLALVEAKIIALGDRRRCQLIHAAHAKRVRSLLKGQEDKARPPLPEGAFDDEDSVLVTALVLPDPDAPIMREEIFGPLLPMLKVKSVEEAAAFVAQRPKPLVVYCYSPDEADWAVFCNATSSGNLAVNCGPQRMQSNFNVGFGGVGESGYGHSIWGTAAFDDYSHHKTVFRGKKFGGSVWGASPPPAKGAGKGK